MKRVSLLISLFLISWLGINAQTINLEQARLLALANSRSLARHELAIHNSILNERSHFYSILPQISADYRANMNFMRDWEFLNPIDTLTASVGFSISQVIFQGGRSFIQRAIRGITTESARKAALAEYFNVLDVIDNAYYAVLEAAAALEAEESSLQTAVLSLSMAEVRQMTGMINQGEYLRAMVDKEVRENSLNQARRNFSLSLARFRTLTGITEAVELQQIDFSEYDDVLTRLALITDEEADRLYKIFWGILAESNPALATAALNNQTAELSLSNVIRTNAPTISASVSSSILNYSTADGFETPSGTGRVTISGTIPVDFWVMNNQIETSKNALDRTILGFADTESSLGQELQNALFNLFTQASSVLSSRRSLEITERHFEFVMERYRLSQGSVSDLNEATTLFINSRNSLNRTSFAFLQSLSRLRSLCALDDENELLRILLSD